jgi:hypothetical protein
MTKNLLCRTNLSLLSLFLENLPLAIIIISYKGGGSLNNIAPF